MKTKTQNQKRANNATLSNHPDKNRITPQILFTGSTGATSKQSAIIEERRDVSIARCE
jgi:hypothetical protein